MEKRDTRVQIVIVENGKYILLKHLAKKERITFWGLPGGGRESGETDAQAAVREAREETGLDVNLLPISHEVLLPEKKFVYRRLVTFLAYPVSGEAQTGFEPEAQHIASYNYELVDLKWQDFYLDDGLESFTKKSVQPIRELLNSFPINQKAGVLAYRKENGALKFLMASSQKNPGYWVFPQGAVRNGEYPEDAARRNLREQAGLDISHLTNRGFFLYEEGGKAYRTDVFSGPLGAADGLSENHRTYWINAQEASHSLLFRESKRFIEELSDELLSAGGFGKKQF